MPAEVDQENIVCAALGDNDEGLYTVHIVNNVATRRATLKGLPTNIEWMKIYVTNSRGKMSQRRMIRVRDGEGTFTDEAHSFITLLVDGESFFNSSLDL